MALSWVLIERESHTGPVSCSTAHQTFGGLHLPSGGRLAEAREALPSPCTSAEAVIATWVPQSVRDAPPSVLAEARTLAAALRPETAMAARRLLWALSPFGAWTYETVGSFTAHSVNSRNVEVWVMSTNAHLPQGWRNAARSVLRQVGREVNPLGWPEQPDEVGRPPACAPYDAIEESIFREAAGLPGVDDLATTLWVASASCGAGMRGPEISAAELDDIQEVGESRLVVQVRGRDARLVPIRADWTDTTRQALQLAHRRAERCPRFVIPQDRNAAARAANRIRIGDMSLSLRRARATWLTAHLEAGTPLPVLREVAGPVAAATLDDLLTATSAVTPEQAVAEALRA